MPRKVHGARTTYSNSTETDLLPVVSHDVCVFLDDGRTETVRLLAEAPDDAIRIVQHATDAQYASFVRVPDSVADAFTKPSYPS